jgi:sugar/nucleoside kinase (ribokinase family)
VRSPHIPAPGETIIGSEFKNAPGGKGADQSVVAALVEGKPLEQAVMWGNAAGALAATRLGAQPSLPIREEVQKLLATGIKDKALTPARWRAASNTG